MKRCRPMVRRWPSMQRHRAAQGPACCVACRFRPRGASRFNGAARWQRWIQHRIIAPRCAPTIRSPAMRAASCRRARAGTRRSRIHWSAIAWRWTCRPGRWAWCRGGSSMSHAKGVAIGRASSSSSPRKASRWWRGRTAWMSATCAPPPARRSSCAPTSMRRSPTCRRAISIPWRAISTCTRSRSAPIPSLPSAWCPVPRPPASACRP